VVWHLFVHLDLATLVQNLVELLGWTRWLRNRIRACHSTLPSHAVLYIVVLNVHLKVQLSEYLVTTVLD